MDLTSLTVSEARDLLRQRKVSSEELTRAHLERIERVDPLIQAFVTLTPEIALEQARAADRRIQAGEDGALLGVPVALKDVLITEGVRTTCGSKILEDFVPIEDGTVPRRLREAGAVLLGKTNMDEFAMGSSNENSAYFPTRNPWDRSRVPGGSSGGSAAAVAARLAPFALGTDTGGSVRQPASLCGVVGMKPTYGRVSRYGLVAFASSLDQIGPFARSVRDCALALKVISGHDPCDSTSLFAPVPDYTAALGQGVKGLRLGIPRQYFVEGMEAGVEQAVRQAIAKLEELGAQVEEVSLPHTKYGLATYYLIAPSECSANLARYDGVKYGYLAPDAETMWEGFFKSRERGFGEEVKRRIMLGTYALSAGYYEAYYLKAQKVRTLIKQDFDEAFKRVDAIVAATSPTVAFPIGAKVQDPLAMYLSDVLTLPVNLAGLPGISLPCGFSDGLPVGLQIIGPALGEEVVLRVAQAYEEATEWDRRAPEVRGRAPEGSGQKAASSREKAHGGSGEAAE